MTAPASAAAQDHAEDRPSSRKVAWTGLRVTISVAALVALYYLLSLDHSSTPAAVTMLLIGLAAFIALVAVQVRLVIRSPFPGLRAIESLATSVPFFLLLFASTYVVLAATSASNFGGHLSHTDGLYFTVTVFSTVGFGDITAKTETARLVVTGQMIADLIILGLAIKIIVDAVRRGRHRQRAGALPSSRPAQATAPRCPAWPPACCPPPHCWSLPTPGPASPGNQQSSRRRHRAPPEPTATSVVRAMSIMYVGCESDLGHISNSLTCDYSSRDSAG
jgi:voltage-gated potassium channel